MATTVMSVFPYISLRRKDQMQPAFRLTMSHQIDFDLQFEKYGHRNQPVFAFISCCFQVEYH